MLDGPAQRCARLLRRQGIDRHIDLEDHAAWREREPRRCAELARQAVDNQPSAQPLALRLAYQRAVPFRPADAQPLARSVDGGGDLHPAVAVRQSAMLGGVGGEFMQDERERLGGTRADHDGLAFDQEASRAERLCGGTQDQVDRSVRPAGAKEEIVNPAEGGKPFAQRDSRLLQIGGGAQRLRGDGRHHRKVVLQSVMEFFEQDAMKARRLCMFGGVKSSLRQKPAEVDILGLEAKILLVE